MGTVEGPAVTPAIGELSLTDLMNAVNVRTAAVAAAKADLDEAVNEVTARFADSAKQAFAQAGKSHGTINLPLQDQMTAKAEISQRVKWDSGKLMAIAQGMPWERVSAIFKIDFSISETVYKGLAALSPELRKQIDEARTVVIGEPKITLAKVEG